MTAGEASGSPGSGGSTATGAWAARVWADRDHYELMRARQGPDASVTFPAEVAEREVPLLAEETRIGRRGLESPEDVPEIDLTGPPRDPGVSHLHAVLLALPGNRWVVLDPGSTNGTTLNYAEEPIAVDTPVPLSSGDRIHVGAWTTITVVRR